MMQVSVGLTTLPFPRVFFFFLEKKAKKVKLLILLPLGVHIRNRSDYLYKNGFGVR